MAATVARKEFDRSVDHWCEVCSRKAWASRDKCSQCICVPKNDASVPQAEAPIEPQAEASPPPPPALPLSSDAEEATAPAKGSVGDQSEPNAAAEATAPEGSVGDQSEPSAVAAKVQEAAEPKLEAEAASTLLPQYTNMQVHSALHAYGTTGINIQGACEGTQRWYAANYLNYRGPPGGRPFYKPWEGEKVIRLSLCTGRPVAVAGVPKPYFGALVSACITQDGEIIAAGDVLTNKPKPRGAGSMDNTRVSFCMGILIPQPELSGGDKAVKAVVMPYKVSGLI